MPNGCQEWRGVKNKLGYGLISLIIIPGRKGKRTTTSAHRAHYMAYYNTHLDKKTVVRHSCDNPACVKITHLFPGTHKDNMADKVKRGRCAKKYKTHLRERVHSNEIIKAIKEMPGKQRDVAKMFGVHETYVSTIKNGKRKALLFKE